MASVGGEGQAWPLDAPESQTLIVLSYDPETMVLPSGEKATEATSRLWALFSALSSSVAAAEGKRALRQLGARGGSEWPLDAPESHTLIVLSRDPETMVLPSGEKATE